MIEFPHTITFEKQSKVPDGAGGNVLNWVTVKTVDAFVQPISGNTLYFAQQNQSKITHKVFMEYDETINSNLRIKYGRKVLTFHPPIDQGGLNEILVLMCESGE
ncbi:phage head closure protein [Mesobacillus foraminis]|uniref:SPP1 family predicted phage head-tail adaptor n=1 Tax=Mesobacillus foraminis TaxID=279826 RepID=A0A4R2BFA9_9BACI|nr:phage head closure protein [Mesobacillus foraminis]TCN25486.1 SPP1 family predicted phage head-tail adaptor [Mesobacillus foraminis]